MFFGGKFTVLGCSQLRSKNRYNMVPLRDGKIWVWTYGETDPKGGHDAVFGNGLQETGSSGQALQSRPAGWEEGANHNHPRWRPSQRADHQVPVDSFTKPWEDGRKLLEISDCNTKTCCERTMAVTGLLRHKWTYLSLRTTPSMQAPNSTTLDMSGRLRIRNTSGHSLARRRLL